MLDFLKTLWLQYTHYPLASFFYIYNNEICNFATFAVTVVTFFFPLPSICISSFKRGDAKRHGHPPRRAPCSSFASSFLPRTVFAFIAFLIMSAISLCMSMLIKNYRLIPSVDLYSHNYSSVIEKLEDLSVQYIYDDSQGAHISDKLPSDDSSYRICGISPSSDQLVPVGSTVCVYLTHDQGISSPIKLDLHAEEIYFDSDTAQRTAYKSNHLRLTCPFAGAISFSDSDSYFYWGASPIETTYFSASLLDAETHKIIQCKLGTLGGSVDFWGIPDGAYYYVIEPAYGSTITSSEIFQIDSLLAKYDAPILDAKVISYPTFDYSFPFQVQVRDEQNQPVPDEMFRFRMVCEQNVSAAYNLITDHYSYLCRTAGALLCDSCSFRLYPGFQMEISRKGSNQWYPVVISGNLGIAVIPSAK